MALRKIPVGDSRWFLMWKPGGEIALVHAYREGALIDCPKCEAPMLFTGQLAICYACGTSFGTAGGLVSRPFRRHSWPDSSCGVLLAYDKTKPHDWWAALRPEGLPAKAKSRSRRGS
jgi:hypothetical protein